MTISEDYTYRCFNDCMQSGCPGHSMRLSYDTTSDTIQLIALGHKDSHGEWVNERVSKTYDKNELVSLLSAWRELRERV